MKYRVERLSANWDATRREPVAEFASVNDACDYVDKKQSASAVSFCAYRVINTEENNTEYRVTDCGGMVAI